jgi:hypothetical protein
MHKEYKQNSVIMMNEYWNMRKSCV